MMDEVWLGVEIGPSRVGDGPRPGACGSRAEASPPCSWPPRRCSGCRRPPGPGKGPRGGPSGRSLFVEDFDRGGGLAGRWEGTGAIRAARVPVAGATIPGVAGAMVRVEARTGLLAEDGAAGGEAPPRPLRADRLPGRRRVGHAAHPVVLEVQFLAEGRRARWWRKVELDRPGWREVDLPLDSFRTGGGVPAWEEVDRLGFAFRTGATLGIDGIELRPGGTPTPPTCPRRGWSARRSGAVARPASSAGVRSSSRPTSPGSTGPSSSTPWRPCTAGPGPTCRPCRPPPPGPAPDLRRRRRLPRRSGRDSPAGSGARRPRRGRAGSPPWGSPPPRPGRTRPRSAPSSSTRRRTP